MPDFDYPLLLEPINVPRPWGAGRVCKLYNRPCANSEMPIGETWDISSWPTDPGNENLPTVTKIKNGPLADMPLDSVVKVPVVVKLLDTAEKLSVQIHPVSETEHKDEMWYILHSEPGSYLYCGLKDGVDKNELCELVRSPRPDEDKVLSMMRRYDNPKPGDYFNVPTGTVHAVGPGIVAYEVSEAAQITYRLFDYNRGRALHIEEGCAALMKTRPNWPVLRPKINIECDGGIDAITEFPTFVVYRAKGRLIRLYSIDTMFLITATFDDCNISGGPNDLWNITVEQSYSCLAPQFEGKLEIDTLKAEEVLITALKS